MKFCFINPCRYIRKGNVWSVINSITPPLGLAMLSAVLEQHGYDSQIIDANALELSVDETIAQIAADVTHVGITASTPEINVAKKLARTVRGKRPGLTILMGGVHPSVEHVELVSNGDADIVVRGEGENAIVELASGKSLAEINGITWRANGVACVNNDRTDFVELDSLPLPAYEKLPMKKYRSALGAAKKSPSIGIITSRGCPGMCSFCYSGMFGSKIRFMAAENVIKQIDMLQKKYGIKEISFYDDTFTANRKRVQEICERIIAIGMKVSWSCFARVDTVSPELLLLMKKAGCHQVGYGFESPDEEILRNINKKISTDKIAEAVKWTKEAGIDVRGAFMFGNIGETADTLQKTLDYSISLGIQYAIYNITTPFPGTALYDQAKKENMLSHSDWDKYDLSHVILDLPSVRQEVISEYYAKAYKRFYVRPRYIFERLTAIRTLDDISIYWRAFTGLIGSSSPGKYKK